jgi:hypothetical protein
MGARIFLLRIVGWAKSPREALEHGTVPSDFAHAVGKGDADRAGETQEGSAALRFGVIDPN